MLQFMGSKRVRHDLVTEQQQDIFACCSSTPVRFEHEGGTAAWLVGTLAAQSVQGHGLPLPQELWPSLQFSHSVVPN